MREEYKPRILIVDDSPVDVMIVENVLRTLDAVIITAQSGNEALSLMLRNDFSVVLLDVQMSGRDGFETASLMRDEEATQHVPMIFVTAISKDEEYVFKGYEAGAVDYLFKPINPHILKSKVNVFLELDRQKRASVEAMDHLKRSQAELLREIEERKRIEGEKEALITELEVRNRELEEFSYTFSHDLKNPLLTIRSFADILQTQLGDGDSEETRLDLTRINLAANKMQILLDGLVKAFEAGKRVEGPKKVFVGDVAREAVEMGAGKSGAREVRVDIAADLPAVVGDPLRLRMLLQNLIDNAAKYMGDQSEPRIEIGVRRDDGQAVCYVRDNGMGMDPRYVDKAFRLFDKMDGQSGGTGVGLSLAKRIVEVHGGRIWIESDGPERGSAVCFILPSRHRNRA